MTFASVCRPLLATALLLSWQAHAQLDDLFRSPGSQATVPVERKSGTYTAPAVPTARNAPALPATAAQTSSNAADTRPSADETVAASSPSPTTDHRVVIYTTPTCPHCHRALKHMQTRNIPYVQKDVQHNAENRAEFKRIGGRGVPHILIGDQVMVGFSPQGFDQRHKAWQAGTRTAR